MTNDDNALSAVWIVRYGDEEWPVPFAYPISRAEAAELLVGADSLRPLTEMTDSESSEIAQLLLHVLLHGSDEQRTQAHAVPLDDGACALRAMREIATDLPNIH